ncbi:hypothetical protein MBLNU457_6074t2 [Dothideomycetes sp. NU457]
MRTLPHASPLVGLPGSVIPAISPVFPTFSRKSAQHSVQNSPPATTTEMQELALHPAKTSARAAAVQQHRTASGRKPWYLNSKILNLLLVVSVGDTIAAIAVLCVQSQHNGNTAGFVVWLTVAVGITAVLLSFVVCLKIIRCQIAPSEVHDIDLERTGTARQEEAVLSDNNEQSRAVSDEEVSPKSSNGSLRQEQQSVERKPANDHDHDHFYFEHPDFEFAQWHRSNQGSPASQTGRFVRSGISRTFSPYKVQQSGLATDQPDGSSVQRPESKLLPDKPVIIRPPELAHPDSEQKHPSPLFSYPTNNGRGPVTAADTLRASEEILVKLRTRQSARTLASPRQHVSKTATASDLSSLVRHMARAPELSAYSNRPSGSKPDIRWGVDHKPHAATFDCVSPVAKPTIRHVEPSSPTSTSSESSMSLPLRNDEAVDNKDDDADKNNTKAPDQHPTAQTAHSLARTASWETVQTTATSLYRAPSSPANPHFNNSIPSLPTLARDSTLTSQPSKINTILRPSVPGSFPLTSPTRPRSLLKKARPASTLLQENSTANVAKEIEDRIANRDTPVSALRKSSIKRLQSATSARLRRTVRKIDIYHDPVSSNSTATPSTTHTNTAQPGQSTTQPMSPRSTTSLSRANSLSPRSNPPRSPDEKENLADYAGAFAGGGVGEVRFLAGLERDDDERRSVRGRYTPEIWEDEGMLVGAGFEGVEVYEGT